MKPFHFNAVKTTLLFALVVSFVVGARAQQTANLPVAKEYSVVSSGLDSRTWMRSTYSLSSSGEVVTNVHRIVELQSGLNHWTENGYALSDPSFQLSADGQSFVANKLQYNLQVAANLNANGAVSITTPDGVVLHETPIAIALFDPATSNTLFIGAITNCSGDLVSSNEVYFESAFEGVSAGIFYAIDRGSFQQSVLFNAAIDPTNYGFSSNCVIQIFNEFYGAPTPEVTGNILRFGQLKFGQGRIYTGNSLEQNGGALVGSTWTTAGDRQFLVESVKYSSLQAELQTLPKITMRDLKVEPAKHGYAAIPVPHPPAKTASIKNNEARIIGKGKVAGVGADFVALVGETNELVLQGDETYFISGPMDCDNLIIEGGSVIKYPNDTTAYIEVDSNLTCEIGPYLMATFTGGDDDSIGQSMDDGPWGGYTGTIQPGGYANPALLIANATTLSNIRINYAVTGVEWDRDSSGSGPLAFNDCQIENSCCGLTLPYLGASDVLLSLVFNNCLLVNNTNLVADDAYQDYENFDFNYCTIDSCDTLIAIASGTQAEYDALFPYNSILSDFNYYVSQPSHPGELGQPEGANNGYYNTPGLYDTNYIYDGSFPFQSAAGGNYYLADSTFRSKGENSACEVFGTDPGLIADLGQRTTWAPTIYDDQNISSLGALAPAVLRDTNSSPDLGYHYSALDDIFAGAELQSNLSITNGTAMGWFYDYDPNGVPDAITLDNSANLSINGTATQPCILARTTMVQENGNINWYNSTESAYGAITFNGGNTNLEPLLFANFTKWTSEGSASQLTDPGADGLGTLKNCEFYNGSISAYGIQSLDFTNCLLFRSDIGFWDSQYALNFAFENCTFYNGGLACVRASGLAGDSSSIWLIENTTFDGTAFYRSDNYNGSSGRTLFNYDAYNTNNLSWQTYPNFSSTYGTNEVGGANDLLTGDYGWQTSWFGSFYLPTDSPLLQKGSTNANLFGLYWFTTQTNQVREGTNRVTIGYHYVATDGNGNPLATIDPYIPNYIAYPDGPPTNLVVFIFPTNESVLQGSNATFSAIATGTPPLSYQWYWEGNLLSDGDGISGSESATLNLASVEPDEAGNYYVVVTNSSGSVTSTNAQLTVQLLGTNAYDTPPLYIMPPYAYWNVTDISDPAQPVNIGELQEPFGSPSYTSYTEGPPVIPENTPWHTNIIVAITNAFGTAAYGGSNNMGTVFEIGLDGGTNFVVIHTFHGTNDGAYPSGQLAISGSPFYGISNVLYGTTSGGGINGLGTVYKVNGDGTGFTNLYQFTGTNDGKNPQTGLLIYGNTLYGTTTNTIFKINTDGSDFTCLITKITNASQLVLSMSGETLYGTTSNGSDYGSIFSINTDGTGFTTLYTFTGGTNGGYPSSGLELYGIGTSLEYGLTNFPNFTLYGTTINGGAHGFGMVYSITNDGTGFIDLHDFNSNDGAYPIGGLVLTNNNVSAPGEQYMESCLFGTTSSGGTNDAGTIFCINQTGQSSFNAFRNLYNFSSSARPEGKLAFFDQTVCGTTSGGGAYGHGMVFSLDCYGTNFSDLHDFNGTYDGSSPLGGLALPVVDNLASIWSLDTTINVSVTNLSYSITIDDYDILFVNGNLVTGTNLGGAQWPVYLPLTGLHPGENDLRVVIGANCDHNDYFGMAIKSPQTNSLLLFGTASAGGSQNDGTVFEVGPGGEANLHSFSDEPDGKNPIGDLVLSGSMLYGVTVNGGTYGYGEIFRINTNGLGYTNLYSFTGLPDGNYPFAGLILSGNILYGTTEYGGSNVSGAYNNGTIFRINTNGSGYQTLYSFADGNDGQNPQASLLLISNTLYGTTEYGGAYDYNYGGTIFSICTNGIGYTNLYSFGATSSDGLNPLAPLVSVSNMLYGTASGGGSNGYYGTIYRIGMNGSNYETVYSFSGSTNDGANPKAGLTLSGGTLYGTTFNGYDGGNGEGTIFSIGVNGSGYTNFLSFGSFDTEDGQNPQAKLTVLGNSLYGTVHGGGDNYQGMVFSVSTNGTDFNDVYDFMGNVDGDGQFPEGGLCSP